MTIYYINGKAHIAVSNTFKPISDREVYDLLESDEIIHFKDVNIYD
jgi:hypothetical protein